MARDIVSGSFAVTDASGDISTAFLQTQRICTAGDSIAQQNTTVTGGTYSYNARGPVAWMLCFLGWPWDYEPSDNYAEAGTTLDVIIRDQLPRILAANKVRRYTRCFISAGTNDAQAGRLAMDIKADLYALFQELKQNGIIAVHTGIRPRGADVSLTNAKKLAAELNQYIYQLSRAGLCEFIPSMETYADNSAGYGNALTALMYDSGTNNLHPNSKGAMLEGWLMSDYYVGKGVVPGITFASMQSDVFDRTYNPQGVAFNAANPLLQGGTTAPTGMTTSGGTWSKVSRNLANGQTRSDASCALAASTVHYLYDDWVATGAWSATQLQPGDIIEARAKITLATGVAIKNFQLRLSENDGTTSLTHYGMFTTTDSLAYTGDITALYFKTPRVTVSRYSGSGNASVFARMECETAGGASGTYNVQQLEIRKVG